MFSKIPEKPFFIIVLILAITASVGGVFFAVYFNDYRDGGRGGVIALGLSLFALFGTRNYAEDVYNALTVTQPKRRNRLIELMKVDMPEMPINDLEKKFEALEKRLKLASEGQEIQNFYLALSTAIGTIFAGFGDKFAFWIICLSNCPPS